MGFQTSFDDPESSIILDASVAINLIATSIAGQLIDAVPNRVIVTDVVLDELKSGHRRGRSDGNSLLKLIEAGRVEVGGLGDTAEQIFESLVIGDAAETLDDGEAATIAYAVEHNAIALIDERKAIRISGRRYPDLRVSSSVDLFAHPAVSTSIDRETLSQAVFGALQVARMNVLPHRLEWIVELIGLEKALQCPSLPSSIRRVDR
jgi:predicted nucleic acid-binding protein